MRHAEWGELAVTFNNYCSDLYWLDKFYLDLMAAAERGIPRAEVEDYICKCRRRFDDAFREADIPLKRDFPSMVGMLVKRMSNALGGSFSAQLGLRRCWMPIYGSPRSRLLDLIGLDYYDPFAAHIFRLPVWWDHESRSRSFHDWIMNSVTAKWWDWSVLPSGLRFFCKLYSEDFNRPILIAENGMALEAAVQQRAFSEQGQCNAERVSEGARARGGAADG